MSDQKLYVQIFEGFKTDILNGKYAYGDKLPSLNELCDEFDVGRNTIRYVMMLLEERGFIKNQRGSKAIVVFDINEMASQEMYLKSIYERKQAYDEIYELLTWFMPELIVELKTRASKQQLDELILKINAMYDGNNKATTQKELSDKLYGITIEAISLLDNSLLDSLYLAFIRFLYLPMPSQVNKSKKLSNIINIVAESLPMIAKFLLSRNNYMLKKAITFLMQAFTRSASSYVDRIGNDMDDIEFVEFKWVSMRNLNLRYMQTVVQILQDINKQKYIDTLPSLQQLSETYNVSLRTVRKACDILDTYKVIQKANGQKSKIIANKIQEPKLLLSNQKIVENIVLYKEAFQILMIMAKGLNKPVLSACSNDEIDEFIHSLNHISKSVLSDYLEFLFSHSSQSVHTIYKELAKSLAWNIYSDSIFDTTNIDYDFKTRSNDFITYIHNRKYDEINNYLSEIYNIIETNIHLITSKEKDSTQSL